MLHEKLGNTQCSRQDYSMDGRVDLTEKAAANGLKPAVATSAGATPEVDEQLVPASSSE